MSISYESTGNIIIYSNIMQSSGPKEVVQTCSNISSSEYCMSFHPKKRRLNARLYSHGATITHLPGVDLSPEERRLSLFRVS